MYLKLVKMYNYFKKKKWKKSTCETKQNSEIHFICSYTVLLTFVMYKWISSIGINKLCTFLIYEYNFQYYIFGNHFSLISNDSVTLIDEIDDIIR